ncbi:helix-turn-helix domain-containing protein [Prosthecomicrobium sp. N25]|uniref:helix-turn-helix domain-containing protein n=1 Tax=Prosthecomicrobium sp. N25 TaxID=3129254 RepID=UPI0030786CBB
MSSAPERLAYTVADACKVLGIGRTTLYKLASEGVLKLVRIGGRTLVPRRELDSLIERASAEASSPVAGGARRAR